MNKDDKTPDPTPDPTHGPAPRTGTREQDGSAGGETPTGGPGAANRVNAETAKTVEELGGPKGPEPTRYGDWEVGGRCSDF
jgi:hypothetical protein